MPTQGVFVVIFPVSMSTWSEYGLSFAAVSFFVNDGSKNIHQYKGEY